MGSVTSTLTHPTLDEAAVKIDPLKQVDGEMKEEIIENDPVARKAKVFKTAREVFLQGNRLFRESRFDLARQEYSLV